MNMAPRKKPEPAPDSTIHVEASASVVLTVENYRSPTFADLTELVDMALDYGAAPEGRVSVMSATFGHDRTVIRIPIPCVTKGDIGRSGNE